MSGVKNIKRKNINKQRRNILPNGGPRKDFPMKRFKKVYIEITNVCNLSCDFCPGTHRKPGFMSPESFRTVLEKLRGYTEFVYLHVMGEPLLHPELSKCLEFCSLYGFKVNITTNGTLIAGASDKLLACGTLRQVNFSLHSHEKVRDESDLDKYFDDIFEFTEKALAQGGVFISYRLWNLTSGASDSYNAYVARKLEQRFKPGFSVLEELKCKNRITLGERLFINSAEVFRWPSQSPESSENHGFCLGLRDQAAVLTDGTVVPCCLDSDGKIPLGNLFDEELSHILNGERAKAIYDGFSKRCAVEELCRNCSYRSRFS